jgi:L-lactate dehydrogenase complex protein LldF
MKDSTFRSRADAAVGTSPVAASARGARRFTDNRLEAVAAFGAIEETRDAARRIRLHTLANLDSYLARFAEQVEANGGTVHWAADAAEANDIVVAIARTAAAATAVKSKSMVTEETELNDALGDAGIDVVETDLGEFIIQLAGDRPSHIIAPVMHKTRQDIGDLFERRLGIEYTDDPEELNAAARRHLRRIFLEAGIGISGVNFAVAESGSIALVTNEGNGRLTTTAPAVHVAVMGMERIVPTFRDLGVMLDVLARSATGQKLTSYTTVVTGPRRPGDPDGPEEFHVVVLDNGRSEVLGQSTAEILACIRCGACLNVCPVYRESGGHAYGTTYAGPVGAVLNPSLLSLNEHGDLAYASSLCGACLEVCPIRIDLPGMLVELRNRNVEAGLDPVSLRRAIGRYTAAATRPAAYRALLRAGGLFARLTRSRDGWIASLPFMGKHWTAHRDFPKPAARPFHRRWRDRDGR